MKANTPDRIWIDPTTDLPKLSGHIDKNSVEYVSKDAFIEKACSYIRLHSALLDTENNDCMIEWLDKFRNVMKK